MSSPRSKEINTTIRSLRGLWSAVPNWRLGQLIANAFEQDIKEDRLFYLSDKDFTDKLTKYINEKILRVDK